MTPDSDECADCPDPLEFKRGVFYASCWIEQRMGGMVTYRTFLDKLGLNKTGKGRIFEAGLWGDEILDAVNRRQAEIADKPVPDTASLLATGQVAPARTAKRGKDRIGMHEIA